MLEEFRDVHMLISTSYDDEAVLDTLLLERYIEGANSNTVIGTVTIGWHVGAPAPSMRALANLALVAAATGPYLWAECGQLLAHVLTVTTGKTTVGSSPYSSAPVRHAASLQSGVGYDSEEDGPEVQSTSSPSLRCASLLTTPSFPEDMPEDWCVEGQGEWEAVDDNDVPMTGMMVWVFGCKDCKDAIACNFAHVQHQCTDANQEAATTCAVQANRWPNRKHGDDHDDDADHHRDDTRRNNSGSDEHTAAGAMSNQESDRHNSTRANNTNAGGSQRQHSTPHHIPSESPSHRSVPSSGGDQTNTVLLEEEDAWLAEALAAQDIQSDEDKQDDKAAGYGTNKTVMEETSATWDSMSSRPQVEDHSSMSSFSSGQYVLMVVVVGCCWCCMVVHYHPHRPQA